VDDVVTKVDALIADINTGARDQLFNFALALPAKRTIQSAGIAATRGFVHNFSLSRVSCRFKTLSTKPYFVASSELI